MKNLIAGFVLSLACFAGFSADVADKPIEKPAVSVKSQSEKPENADIAAASARGDVWVNLKSHVYHSSGSRWYGKTAAGKFMTEADAKSIGGHASGTKLNLDLPKVAAVKE